MASQTVRGQEVLRCYSSSPASLSANTTTLLATVGTDCSGALVRLCGRNATNAIVQHFLIVGASSTDNQVLATGSFQNSAGPIFPTDETHVEPGAEIYGRTAGASGGVLFVVIAELK